MKEVALVIGSETLAGRKLIEKLLSKGHTVVAPVPGKETETRDTETDNLCVISWNRASWFSAKNVVRETIRRFGKIDTLWLFHQRSGFQDSLEASAAEEIEMVIDESIKGSVAAAREALPYLKQSSGFLGMVIPHQSGIIPGPLESLVKGAFTGLADYLIKNSSGHIWSCGILSNSPDADGFAERLIIIKNEKPPKLRGKWFIYSEKRKFPGKSSIVENLK